MQSRVSPSLAVLTSLFLLSASDLVLSQISAPNCTSGTSLWQWSFNSIGQNPCTIAAYLMGTCYGGDFTLDPIQNLTYSYSGPDLEEAVNLCICNSVAYNLLSACGMCQGGQQRTWSDYTYNCSSNEDPSTFPNPIPAGTRVPQWALQDATHVNLWNATKAMTIGDTPEILPGELIGTSASSSISPTPSASSSAPASTSPVSTSSGSRPNKGAIAGGVVGGVIIIAATAGLGFIFWRRRRRSQAPFVALFMDGASPAPSASQTSHHTQESPLTLYDPNNPSTFPQQRRRRTDLHTRRERSRRFAQWVPQVERGRSHQHAVLTPAGLPWPAYCLISSHSTPQS
ncbi:hypothetical protein BJY52DRAFT_375035 [Lactarius psammicola]|nr:hypothetical protein BJY52DRAFT_375035 [Lactarius psammicola]